MVFDPTSTGSVTAVEMSSFVTSVVSPISAIVNGGSLPAVTIQGAATNTVSLTINTIAGQTADLVQIIDTDHVAVNSGYVLQIQKGRIRLFDPAGVGSPTTRQPEFHYTGSAVLSSGTGQGKTAEWAMGIDTGASTPGRDFFFGPVNYPSVGNVLDVFYWQDHTDVSLCPSLGLGRSSPVAGTERVSIFAGHNGAGTVLPTMGCLNLGVYDIGPTRTSGKVLRISGDGTNDRGWINPYPDYGWYIVGDSVTTPIGPAFVVQDRSKTGGQGTTFKVDANGRITTDQTGTGNTADIVWAQTTQAGATLNINTRGSGSARSEIWTTNNADLILGTNGVARFTVAKTTGGLTQAYAQTLGGATGDVTLDTRTPVIAGAFTATRLNYLQVQQPTGAATITDAAVFQFDAAIGTHKAVDAATTKTTPGAVTAWIKVNINGTIHYMPAYSSKTS